MSLRTSSPRLAPITVSVSTNAGSTPRTPSTVLAIRRKTTTLATSTTFDDTSTPSSTTSSGSSAIFGRQYSPSRIGATALRSRGKTPSTSPIAMPTAAPSA